MKNYKKYKSLFITNFFLLICFLIFIIISFIYSYNEYTNINATFVLDNIIKLIIDEKDLKKIQKNKYIYLNSKKQKITIEQINRNIYEIKKRKYHEVLIKGDFKISKDIHVSIFSKKKKYHTLFKECWKE